MSIQLKLDWLTFTVPYGNSLPVPTTRSDADDLAHKLMWAMGLSALSLVDEDAQQHYQWVKKCVDTGMMIRMSGLQSQGMSIVMSATTVVKLGGTLEACKVFANTLRFGSRASRVDLAWDFLQEKGCDAAYISGVIEDALNDHKRTNRKKTVIHDAGGKIETIYLGSRTSAVFHRVYDKAAEQGLEDLLWYRYEIELKDTRAHAFNGDFVGYVKGIIEMLFGERGAAQSSIVARLMDAASAYGDDSALTIPVKSRRQAERLKWWLGQVASAFGNLCDEDPEDAKYVLDVLTQLRYASRDGMK